MPASHRKRQDTLARRKQVSDLYRQGWTIADIADEVNLSARSIYHDLKMIRAIWMKRIADDFDELQSEELAKIDRLERIANESWEQSEKKPSDAKFLDLVDKCISRRVSILGLDDPAKFGQRAAITGRDEIAGVVEVVVETREQAARVLSFQQYDQATSSCRETDASDGEPPA